MRIDVVFDVCLENSLKNSARLHHGEGSRKRVKGNYKVPSNWKAFLRHSENKRELFSFLAKFGHEDLKPVNKTVAFTFGLEVLCSPEHDTSGLESCNHEEADTRIFLHRQDGMERLGLNRVVIHTVDTDVVVLGISAVLQRDALKLFTAFGTQKNFRYINVNDLAIFLGNEKSNVLQTFHAFTGCDTVSFFTGRGTKSAMDTWSVCESLTPVLSNLAQDPDVLSDDDFAVIQQFVVYLCDRTSDDLTVNAARKNLFCKKGVRLKIFRQPKLLYFNIFFDQCIRLTVGSKWL